jgi:hypothetical protein
MTMKKPTDEIKKAVRDWFSREGVKVESIKNPRAEFLFKVKFQRFYFTVVRPNDSNYLQVESQVMISPQHLKKLNSEKMQKFQMEAMKFSFGSRVRLGFVKPQPNQKGKQPPGPGFVVSDRIYDDSFSDDRLWETMSALHGSVEMVIAILNETTGHPGVKPQQPEDSRPSYYT